MANIPTLIVMIDIFYDITASYICFKNNYFNHKTMEKNLVNWFEIPVTDFERAKKFYGSLFNIELQELPMPNMKLAAFPMIQGGENSTGAIVQAEHYEPSTKGSLVYFTCEDVENQLKKVVDLGGELILPKTSIGEHGFIGHFIDSEGNKVALHSVK